ncbi:MAG: alpha-glucan family phosphorylase, partial [Thermodesulfobacteriota bacterium]
MERYFRGFAESLGISLYDLLALGRQDPGNPQEHFCMSVLAMRFSNHRNGVSRAHGKVSKRVWVNLWPGFSHSNIPIQTVTRGVHIPTYISKGMGDLFNRYLGVNWNEEPDSEKVWKGVERIPDTELWRCHQRCKERLVDFARNRLAEQMRRGRTRGSDMEDVQDVLDPDALTLCIGQRFTGYKRGDLLFRDTKRLSRIVNHSDRPVQILISGKAHPQDREGKAMIQNLVDIARRKEFKKRVVFLEDYDLFVARMLVQGADVWLSTPRRHLEACGTSGMKAAVNGALNIGVLDGWWAEGFDACFGWKLGHSGVVYPDSEAQDEIESRELYALLEQEVIPIFYERGRDDMPKAWVQRMKWSIRPLCPVFSSHRMLEEYMDRFYRPGSAFYSKLRTPEGSGEAFVQWQKRVREGWGGIVVREFRLELNGGEIESEKSYPVQARMDLGGLTPQDLKVEICFGPL